METEILTTKRNNLFLVDYRNLSIIPGFNVREDMGDLNELAESIFLHGVKMPLTGHRNPDNPDGYFITDGHRRYYACKLLIDSGRMTEIRLPLYPEKQGTKDTDRIIEMAIRNDGKQLTPIEFAKLVQRLQNYNLSDKEIATKLTKSIAHIANCKLLIEMPETIQKNISKGKISASLAIQTVREIKDKEKAYHIIEKSITDTPETELISETIIKPEKVRKTTIENNSGKINSIKFAKNLYKQKYAEFPVKPEMQATYDLVKQILNNEIDEEKLSEIFFAF